MRLLMMGTGPFAVPTFLSLLASEHQVLALVTRPVPPAKERRKTAPNPMSDEALARAVPVIAPADINAADAQQLLRAYAADLFVVCDYGQILSRETLSLARQGGINLHASLLPKYRGAAPINWALYHGERETGVTVIHMTPRLDGGPCLAVRRVAIEAEETAAGLEQRLAALGVAAVHEALQLLEGWDGSSPLGERQDPALATRAPRLKKSDGQVDWSRPAMALYNQVRALQPWPGTYSFLHAEGEPPLRVILNRVAVEETAASGPPGSLLLDLPGLWVCTGQGALRIEQLQPAGKRVMTAEEFRNGHPLNRLSRFGSD